jgi:hypothetical protein
MSKERARSISKREAVKVLKRRIMEIEVEVAALRQRQQGMEKALSILNGESP